MSAIDFFRVTPSKFLISDAIASRFIMIWLAVGYNKGVGSIRETWYDWIGEIREIGVNLWLKVLFATD